MTEAESVAVQFGSAPTFYEAVYAVHKRPFGQSREVSDDAGRSYADPGSSDAKSVWLAWVACTGGLRVCLPVQSRLESQPTTQILVSSRKQ